MSTGTASREVFEENLLRLNTKGWPYEYDSYVTICSSADYHTTGPFSENYPPYDLNKIQYFIYCDGSTNIGISTLSFFATIIYFIN